jgi:aspartyl-tRNA(Asn)/glutamyl-tRNA(Gln) amidotransferase subunit A
MNAYDKRDPSSLPQAARDLFPKDIPDKFTIGIPQEYNLPSLHSAMKAAWSSAISSLQSAGHAILKISLPRTKEALSTYYVIASAEAASNLARYDGIRFGHHCEMNDYRHSLVTSRAKGFGDEVRRRILLGNYSLSSRHCPVRRLVLIVERSTVTLSKRRKFDG